VEETVEILEALQKEDLLPEIIRSEVNSLVYPIFALNTKDLDKIRKIEYKAVIQRNGQRLEVEWKVANNPEFGGGLGPFEKQIFRTVERIINFSPHPIKNPIGLGSFRNIARLAGLKPDKRGKYGGSVYKNIEDAIAKIIASTVVSKGTFYHKGNKKWMSDYFHLYERLINKGEELSDGTIADTNYLVLGSWYLESINARYVRPLDYSYLQSLPTELSRRFYELFGTKFYYIIQNDIPYIRYKYSTLCQLLPVVRQKYYSDASLIFNPAHQKLTETNFFEKVSWSKEKISNNPPDWYIYYYPGERAKEEYQRHQEDYQVTDGDLIQLMETNVTEPLAFDSPKSQLTPLNKTQESLLNQLVDFGITEKVAEELVKEQESKFITEWLKAIEIIPDLTDKRAYLAKALKEKWALPELYEKKKRQQETIKAQKAREKEEKRKEEEKLQQERREREELDNLYQTLTEEQKQKLSDLVNQEFKGFYCPSTVDPSSTLYRSLQESARYKALRVFKENLVSL